MNKISSEIALAMSADGDSFERVHSNLVKIAEDFAIGFFNWATSYKANDKNNWILTTKQLLEIYKDETTNK